MSTSADFNDTDSSDVEGVNQLKAYGEYLLPEYFSAGESSVSLRSIHPRWRKTPRTAADFSLTKSSISSCKDSDYDAWLENYYQELYKGQTLQSFLEKQVDTADLVEKKPDNVLTSLFPPLEKDIWSYSTKYWGIKDLRRYWPLRIKTGKYLFLPSIHPHLNLRSRYGRFHSLLNSAAAVPEFSHKKSVCRIFKKVLLNVEALDPQLQKIMICDTLCSFKWFDHRTKAQIIKSLCGFLRTQNSLEKVYLENTNLEKLEGIVLLCALSRNGGDFIKELCMWKMFAYGQCPVLLNDLSPIEKILPTSKSTKNFTKIHYLQILNKFSSLTHLSINYAYLANKNGDALMCLKCVRLGSLRELRLLCLKDERPFCTNPGYGVGGWKIADGIWERVLDWCPDLHVSFVFLNMPQYENIILFLSKYIPVSYVYISSGMDFTFDVPWDVDSTLLELRNWYAATLQTLSLHLWHHRDLLDFVIKCKILEEFPNLLNFEFIGVLENIETLEEFCCQLSKGIYTRVIFQIPPYVHYIIKDEAVVLQGSFGQLWNTLEERLGFSSEYMIESYSTGVLNFQNKRRDVLLRPSVISSEDVDKFDFTFPIGNIWYEVFLKDSDEINSSNSYVRNWSAGIWAFTAFMIFLFTVLLFVMLKLSNKFLPKDIYIVPSIERTFQLIQTWSSEDNRFNLPKNWRKMKKIHHNLKNMNDMSLGNCFIAAISVFCSQGIYLQTNLVSVRLSMLSFLIFGMIMYNSYSALLVSQLTLGERFLPFDTLEEIPLKGNEYSLCIRSESYPFLYFTVNGSRNRLQEKWENIVNRKPCPDDGKLSLKDMCQPYVAFLEAPAVMKEFILTNKNCKMMNLRKRYFNVDFSLLILKGFEENGKKELNKEILKYREVGILSHLEEKWI